jgi:hypothetical protein
MVRLLSGDVKGSTGCLGDVERFLRSYGRMKYVRPLFCAMLEDADARDLAVRLAAELKGHYHPICAKVLASDVTKECKEAAVKTSELTEIAFGEALRHAKTSTGAGAAASSSALGTSRTEVTASLRQDRAKLGEAELDDDEAAEADVLANKFKSSTKGKTGKEDETGKGGDGEASFWDKTLDKQASEWVPMIIAGSAVLALGIVAFVMMRRATARQ